MKTPRNSEAGCQEGAPAKLSALLTEAMRLLALYLHGRDPFSMMYLPTDEHPQTLSRSAAGQSAKGQ